MIIGTSEFEELEAAKVKSSLTWKMFLFQEPIFINMPSEVDYGDTILDAQDYIAQADKVNIFRVDWEGSGDIYLRTAPHEDLLTSKTWTLAKNGCAWPSNKDLSSHVTGIISTTVDASVHDGPNNQIRITDGYRTWRDNVLNDHVMQLVTGDEAGTELTVMTNTYYHITVTSLPFTESLPEFHTGDCFNMVSSTYYTTKEDDRYIQFKTSGMVSKMCLWIRANETKFVSKFGEMPIEVDLKLKRSKLSACSVIMANAIQGYENRYTERNGDVIVPRARFKQKVWIGRGYELDDGTEEIYNIAVYVLKDVKPNSNGTAQITLIDQIDNMKNVNMKDLGQPYVPIGEICTFFDPISLDCLEDKLVFGHCKNENWGDTCKKGICVSCRGFTPEGPIFLKPVSKESSNKLFALPVSNVRENSINGISILVEPAKISAGMRKSGKEVPNIKMGVNPTDYYVDYKAGNIELGSIPLESSTATVFVTDFITSYKGHTFNSLINIIMNSLGKNKWEYSVEPVRLRVSKGRKDISSIPFDTIAALSRD